MSSAWDPRGASEGSDPLADALSGVVSLARRFRATMDVAAPPTTAPPAAEEPPSLTLAALGLLSVCAQLEALFEQPVSTEAPAPARPAAARPASRRSLLR